jgi:hypothetical protein
MDDEERRGTALGSEGRGITVEVQPLGNGRGHRASGWLLGAIASAIVLVVAGAGLFEGVTGPQLSPPVTIPSASSSKASPASSPTLAPPPHPEFVRPSTELYQARGDGPGLRLLVGEVPAGAERLALLVGCAGEGMLHLLLDGVEVDFDCGQRRLDGAFVPSLSGSSALLVRADGDLRYVVSVRAWSVSSGFRPPEVLLSGGGRAVPGFPGCELVFRPTGGAAQEGRCGPSWMPIPDDRGLVIEAGDRLRLALAEGWTLTAATVLVADHAAIVPSGRDPDRRQLEYLFLGQESREFDAPPPGDWGMLVLATGAGPDGTFTAHYYFRVLVGE